MSLEQQIDDLTVAIKFLTQAITAMGANIPAPVAAEKPAQPEKAKPAEKAKAEKAKAEKQETPAPAEPAKVIDFATQIQKPIMTLVGTGRRDEAVALLAKYGATRASEVKPEDYAAILEDISKVTS